MEGGGSILKQELALTFEALVRFTVNGQLNGIGRQKSLFITVAEEMFAV